jgi:type II restriction enzyme
MKRNFEQWMLTLKDNIADWNYYTDFDKVYKNTEKIKIELNLLNSLINSKQIEEDFIELVQNYPNVLKAIPILLAKRESEVKISNLSDEYVYNFSNRNYSIEQYVLFMRKTGLFELLENHIISDLVDYVKGVEVGLDSNARKNRTGTLMENLVEDYLVSLGLVKGKNYFTQYSSSDIKKYHGVDINIDIKEVKAGKRFDFVVVGDDGVIHAIEVNYYSGGGSKLNETARSYKMLSQETKTIEKFNFIWITDGYGWHSAKNNLKETFDVLEHLFNLNDLKNNKLKLLLNK